MRVAFLGSPPFGTAVYEHLSASRHTIVALVTPPDRPRGRGRSVAPSPLVSAASEDGTPLIQPATTRDEAFLEELRLREPDVLLVASYGEILRRPVLELAPHGALNVHASLLPRWRGASPIQNAILAGDEVTGVSVQRIVLALDEGDVLLALETRIEATETAGELLVRLAELGGQAAVRALDQLESGEAVFTPQPAAGVTYARKLSKEQGRMDWSQDADQLARFVRAMNPWPAARTRLPDGRELVVLAAHALEYEGQAAPGTLLGSVGAGSGAGVRIAAGRGALELETVKPEGKRAMDAESFRRGARLKAGSVWGHDAS